MNHERFEPAPYQERLARFVFDTPRCALWLRMGLRKTATTLMAVRQALREGEIKRALVVAPLRVATFAWPSELRKWDLFSDLTYTVLRGDVSWREMLLRQETDIHIVNYEKLPWLIERVGVAKWSYDWIIIDESSKLKNPTGQRLRALRNQLRALDKRGKRPRITELTGTQSPNSLMDVWSQLVLLDDGERLGRTVTAYRERYFRKGGYNGYAYTPEQGACEEVAERVRDIVASLNADEYLTLPPLVTNPVPVHLPDAVLRDYKELEKSMLVEFEALEVSVALGEKSHTLVAANAAALTGKCLQYASGAVYLQDELGDPSTEWAEIHTAKLEALDDIIEEATGETVLVAFWYKHDLARLKARYPHARWLRKDEDFAAWNAREVPLAFIHPGSAGHGLNLQDGGNTIVWFSMTWSLELYQQLNARLHRSGQTQPVIVHQLLAVGTLDEEVPRRLEGKASVQDLLHERVRLLRNEAIF